MRLSDGSVYLDANATTPVAPEVLSALEEASRRVFGNPSSAHRPGREARELLEAGRAAVARLVGCLPEEVVFTSSGTEANHLAWNCALGSGTRRRRVLLSAAEHPSVEAQAPVWEGLGFDVSEIPIGSDGRVELAALDGLLREDVALVSVLAAHNETGVLQPLEEVATLCRRAGALLHTDAVQAMGKMPSPWAACKPDYLTLSGHKFYGPKGVGALLARRGSPFAPLLVGGGQEGGRRSSTEPVPLIHALGKASDLAVAWLEGPDRLGPLRDRLEAELGERFVGVVHGQGAPRLPNTSFFSLPGKDAGMLLRELDSRGYFVSRGSACHGGSDRSGGVLHKMGASPELCSSALRVSLGRTTTEADLDGFFAALTGALAS